MSEDKQVGIVMLSETSWLAFSVGQWRGRYIAGVRKFVATGKYEGPTRSGFSVNKELLGRLVTTLEQLENSIPPLQESEFKAITKGDTEFIRVRTLPDEELQDLPRVDIREYIDRPTYQGPTKRGVRFRWNLLPEVIACLRKQTEVIVENYQNEPSLFGPEMFKPMKEQDEESRHSEPDIFDKLLGDKLKQFPDDFRSESPCKHNRIILPEASLRLEEDSAGGYLLRTEVGVFTKVRNPTEAKFMVYAQLRGQSEIELPEEMIRVFTMVKAYENYVRTLRSRLFAKLLKQAQHHSLAEYETDKIFRRYGLPIHEG